MSEDMFHRIVSYMTRTTWLHFQDRLNIDKIQIFAGSYVRGQKAKAMAWHFLDWQDALILAQMLAAGEEMSYKEYKGTAATDGGPVSRVLQINSGVDQKDKPVVWWNVANGPGEVTKTGAIQPKGEPTTVIKVPVPLYLSRRMGAELHIYLTAYRTALAVADVLDEYTSGQTARIVEAARAEAGLPILENIINGLDADGEVLKRDIVAARDVIAKATRPEPEPEKRPGQPARPRKTTPSPWGTIATELATRELPVSAQLAQKLASVVGISAQEAAQCANSISPAALEALATIIGRLFIVLERAGVSMTPEGIAAAAGVLTEAGYPPEELRGRLSAGRSKAAVGPLHRALAAANGMG